jgi:hypothetical protein
MFEALNERWSTWCTRNHVRSSRSAAARDDVFCRRHTTRMMAMTQPRYVTPQVEEARVMPLLRLLPTPRTTPVRRPCCHFV